MQLTYLHGYPDRIGRRFAYVAVGVPPASAPLADSVALPSFNNYIDSLTVGASISTAFQARATPNSAGARAAWSVKYTYNTVFSANVTIATAGTGQTPGSYPITFGGGTLGTGGKAASGTAIVGAGGTIVSTNVYPGYGYTTVPTTATITGSGGTPGTLAVAASAIGAPVQPGVNLSAEQFQCSGFGGTF